MTTNNDDASKLSATPEHQSRTFLGDWTWMQDIPDHAFRIYVACRAFIFDKDPESVSVRITDEELARLTRRSVSAVKRARKACYALGLLRQVSCSVESIDIPGSPNRVRTIRTIWVALAPPADYPGPTNCYTELRRIRRDSEGSNSTPQGDQQVSSDDGVLPGQPEGSNSNDPGSNSNDPGSNSNLNTGSDLQKGVPQVPPHVSPQPTKGPGSLVGEEPNDNDQERREENPRSTGVQKNAHGVSSGNAGDDVGVVAASYGVPAPLLRQIVDGIQQAHPTWMPHRMLVEAIATRFATRQWSPSGLITAATEDAPSAQIVSGRIKKWGAANGSPSPTRGDSGRSQGPENGGGDPVGMPPEIAAGLAQVGTG